MKLFRLQQKNQRSDQELIALFKDKGKTEALGQLFDRYMDLVYAVAFKYLKEENNTKDAVIQIYEKLNKKLKTHEVDNFKSWLHVLTKNHCLEHLRKKNRSKEVHYDPQLMHSVDNVHHDDEFEIEQPNMNGTLTDCIKRLSEKQRKCIELFYYNSKTYVEIAGLLELNQNKVRSFIQNGRRNLKICMEKKHGKTASHKR